MNSSGLFISNCLDFTVGVADLLGAVGGTTTQRRAAIFVQCVSGMTGHLIFACQLARPKKLFLGHRTVMAILYTIT